MPFFQRRSKRIIITDPNKLDQILTNLINNAIKFTDQGTVEFGYSFQNNEIRFYVSDMGIGIEDNLKEKISERFRQEELTIARKYEGVGLGLSISKAYVEMLGGEIWLESEKNKGTTFYFTIPVEKKRKKKIT
ncbi:MAG: ATP-binding protein [Bacteroidales bacterium]